MASEIVGLADSESELTVPESGDSGGEAKAGSSVSEVDGVIIALGDVGSPFDFLVRFLVFLTCAPFCNFMRTD